MKDGDRKTVALPVVKSKLIELFEEMFSHDGHSNMEVKISFLRRGQKEILLCCGKEYRFVVDYVNTP